LRLANHSKQTQTFQIQLHIFRHHVINVVPTRRWEAQSGDFEDEGAVVLRGDVTPPETREVVWELAATDNMTFHKEVLASEGWSPDTAISLVKTGPGRVTFHSYARWNGTATAEEGVLAPEALWQLSGNLGIGPGAALEGQGIIEAPVEVEGRLSPGGKEIAEITFAKGLKISGTTEMSLNAKIGSSDRANVTAGPLTFGGILRVTATGAKLRIQPRTGLQAFRVERPSSCRLVLQTRTPAAPCRLEWDGQAGGGRQHRCRPLRTPPHGEEFSPSCLDSPREAATVSPRSRLTFHDARTNPGSARRTISSRTRGVTAP